MRRILFWLSDDQRPRIAPLLPTDVRGKEREDDWRVISGILHVLKSRCRWCDCRRSTARTRRSTIALCGGHTVACGRGCCAILPSAADRPRRR